MKQTLLLAMAGCLVSGTALAGDPVLLPEFYTNSISPDGKWLVNDGSMGYMELYNVSTRQTISFDQEFVQGNGNCVNNAGTVVGSVGDIAAIIVGDKIVNPEELAKYDVCYLNGITLDGSRTCGLIGNPNPPTGENMMTFLPIVADVNGSGEVSNLTILPVPEKDFFGEVPQYASATYVSDDGKIILGQLIDNSGMFISPIVYREDASGKWSYSLPTLQYFNPEHLTLPASPGEFTEDPPQFEDYMTPEEAAAYQQAYDDWAAGGYTGEYPEYSNYMTEEEIAKYNEAVDEYNAKATEYNDKLAAYFEVFYSIVESSMNFIKNAMVLAPDAKKFLSTAVKQVDNGGWMPEEVNVNYVFDLSDDSHTTLPQGPATNIFANEILPNGVIFGSTPASMWGGAPPQTFVYEPGATDFVVLEDYLRPNNPELSTWMTENLTVNVEVDFDPETYDPIYEQMILSGHAVASNDMKVISGGVMAYYFEEGPLSEYSYASYVFTDVETVGVNNVVADDVKVSIFKNGMIHIEGEPTDLDIYDFAGTRLYHADKVNGLINTGLGNGFYIIKAGNNTIKAKF